MKSHYSFCRLLLPLVGLACRSDSSKVERASTDTSIVAATAAPPQVIGAATEQPQTEAQPTSAVTLPPALTCSPDTIGPNDTLTLRMQTPHGGYLAVVQADRTTYFVIDPYIKSRHSLKYSLIPAEQFQQMAVLRLATDVTAPPRVYGRDSTLEPVFGKPGKYTIEVGENLEGDYSNRLTQCTVTVSVPRS
jgi:hypothetical protein